MKNDLLLFTSKLTEKNSYLTTQIKEMSEELAYFQTNCKLKHLNESLDSIKDQLNETNEKLNLEINRNKVLENELIDKEKEIENLLLKLSDEQDEILTLKKKHANNIKDLTRQLQQFKDKEMSVLDYASKTLSSSEDDLEVVVFIVDKEGTVKKVKVTTAIQDINYIEITEGLKEGDNVISGPYDVVSKLLKEKDKVKIVDKKDLFEKVKE